MYPGHHNLISLIPCSLSSFLFPSTPPPPSSVHIAIGPCCMSTKRGLGLLRATAPIVRTVAPTEDSAQCLERIGNYEEFGCEWLAFGPGAEYWNAIPITMKDAAAYVRSATGLLKGDELACDEVYGEADARDALLAIDAAVGRVVGPLVTDVEDALARWTGASTWNVDAPRTPSWLDCSRLHMFEIVKLAELPCVDSVSRVKEWLPSLGRFSDTDLEALLSTCVRPYRPRVCVRVSE